MWGPPTSNKEPVLHLDTSHNRSPPLHTLGILSIWLKVWHYLWTVLGACVWRFGALFAHLEAVPGNFVMEMGLAFVGGCAWCHELSHLLLTLWHCWHFEGHFNHMFWGSLPLWRGNIFFGDCFNNDLWTHDELLDMMYPSKRPLEALGGFIKPKFGGLGPTWLLMWIVCPSPRGSFIIYWCTFGVSKLFYWCNLEDVLFPPWFGVFRHFYVLFYYVTEVGNSYG